MRALLVCLSVFVGAAAWAGEVERVGLLVIDREATGSGPALVRAARAQVAKRAEQTLVDLRVTKHTSACNLDTFRLLGVDLSFCGVQLPKSLEKLYVVQSDLREGTVELTIAVFDKHDFALMEKRPPRKMAVDSEATYARVLDHVP